MLVRIVSTTITVRHIPRYGCILVSWGQLNGSQGTPLIGQPSYFAIARTTQHDRLSDPVSTRHGFNALTRSYSHLVGSKTRYAVLPRLCGAYPRYHITMEFLTQQGRPASLVPMQHESQCTRSATSLSHGIDTAIHGTPMIVRRISLVPHNRRTVATLHHCA